MEILFANQSGTYRLVPDETHTCESCALYKTHYLKNPPDKIMNVTCPHLKYENEHYELLCCLDNNICEVFERVGK